MENMIEEMKTEFGEYLDENLNKFNLAVYCSGTDVMELFDMMVECHFPVVYELEGDELEQVYDELGQIFDAKFVEVKSKQTMQSKFGLLA